MTATAAPGIVTGGSPPNAVVQIQPGMNVQPVVLVDQNGNYITSSGGTAVALATTGGAVNVSNGTSPTTGEVLTATSGTAATWQVLPSATTSTPGVVQLDGTALDIQPAGTASTAGSNGKPADSGHVHPSPGWLPADLGLEAWMFDPVLCTASGTLNSGVIYLFGLQIRRDVSVSTVLTLTGATGASGVTASQNFIGLYNSGGTRLSQVATDASYSPTNSVISTSLGSTALVPGQYWVGWLMNASTMPTLSRTTIVSTVVANLSQTGATARYATAGATQTTLPATITPSSNSRTNNPIWVGLY